MRSFNITENDAGQRVDKFIQKVTNQLPASLMYKYFRLKRIKLNGKKCEQNAKLEKGDLLELYINDEFFDQKPAGKFGFLNSKAELNIIYEDNNILLLDKPVGLVVHSGANDNEDDLISRLHNYLYKKGDYNPDDENSFTPALCNRLDRNTGGIVIAAKNFQSLRIINEKIKQREIKKLYLCLVHGIPEPYESTLTGYLEKNSKQNRVYITNEKTKKSKPIITKYKVLRAKDNKSLLEIDLITGRTHQIRAHLASVGHPIVGDGKYGTNQLNRNIGFKAQALYSYKISFDFKEDAGKLNYLNNKVFELKDIWFVKSFFEDDL